MCLLPLEEVRWILIVRADVVYWQEAPEQSQQHCDSASREAVVWDSSSSKIAAAGNVALIQQQTTVIVFTSIV
jgi:hypothetical protein